MTARAVYRRAQQYQGVVRRVVLSTNVSAPPPVPTGPPAVVEALAVGGRWVTFPGAYRTQRRWVPARKVVARAGSTSFTLGTLSVNVDLNSVEYPAASIPQVPLTPVGTGTSGHWVVQRGVHRSTRRWVPRRRAFSLPATSTSYTPTPVTVSVTLQSVEYPTPAVSYTPTPISIETDFVAVEFDNVAAAWVLEPMTVRPMFRPVTHNGVILTTLKQELTKPLTRALTRFNLVRSPDE